MRLQAPPCERLLPLYPRGPCSGPGYVVPVHHHVITRISGINENYNLVTFQFVAAPPADTTLPLEIESQTLQRGGEACFPVQFDLLSEMSNNSDWVFYERD